MPEQLNWLVDSVLDPIKTRILKMPWIYRAAILLALLSLFALFEYRDQIPAKVGLASQTLRVSWGPRNRVPLSGADIGLLKASIARLTSQLDPRLTNLNPSIAEAWTVAQVLVAVHGVGKTDLAPAVHYIESQEDRTCSCWGQISDVKIHPHLAVTAWVLIAFAKLKPRAPNSEVQFFLDNQFRDGSWPIFEGATLEEASTYATSLVVLALYEQLNAGLVAKELESKVRASMERGRAWLMSHHRDDLPARWTDYPLAVHNPLPRLNSLGLSGQVLHVLHRTDQAGLADIERAWIRSLPKALPKSTDQDASNRFIENAKGSQFVDSSRYFVLPWSIVATVDAYPSGTTTERARALDWLERSVAALEQAEHLALQSGDYNAAELLIALKYLAKDTP